MKTSHRLGFLGVVLMSAGTAAWAGCSDSSTTSSPGTDAGSGTDAGGNKTDAGGGGDVDSGGGGTDSGGGGTDSGTGADASPSQSCADYCDWTTTKCTTPNDIYPADKARCLKVCSDFNPGVAGDTTMNTLTCRASFITGGSGDAGADCPKGGPYGGKACGTQCEDFCSLALKQCPASFASLSDCTTACAGFTVSGVAISSTGPFSGNTFECRAYHLQAAFDDPVTHCGHIVTASAPCK